MKNKKAFHYIWMFAIVLIVNFWIPRLMPGDPFSNESGDQGEDLVTYSDAEIQALKNHYGMDLPLYKQGFRYLKGVLTGDWGESIFFKEPVNKLIFKRMGWTLFLVTVSTLISALCGTLLGIYSGYKRHKKTDAILYGFFVTFSEIPSFLVALLVLFIFAAQLKWFPLSGAKGHFIEYSNIIEMGVDVVRHAVLPVLSLVITRIGDFYLMARSTTLSVKDKDFMVTAKAKGLSKFRILFVHTLKNVAPPIITRIFMTFGKVLGGAILVENVFAYPGAGRLLGIAVRQRDYLLIQGVFLTMTLLIILMNVLSEIVYKKLDPRLK